MAKIKVQPFSGPGAKNPYSSLLDKKQYLSLWNERTPVKPPSVEATKPPKAKHLSDNGIWRESWIKRKQQDAFRWNSNNARIKWLFQKGGWKVLWERKCKWAKTLGIMAIGTPWAWKRRQSPKGNAQGTLIWPRVALGMKVFVIGSSFKTAKLGS